MPTISEFFGIVIRMFWNDHSKPHFHAFYSGQKTIYEIDPLRKKKGKKGGKFSKRAHRLIKEWAELHKDELLAEWTVLSHNLPGFAIEGLK